MSNRFNPARIERLLSPDRMEWLRPVQVLAELDVSSALRVLDFGCGPGFFTLPLASALAHDGLVVAADVEPVMLDRLTQRARESEVHGILPILCDGQLPFQDRGFDRALASLVYHELGDGRAVLHEIARVLRPGGLLAVIEWQPGQTERGPDPAQRIAPEQLERDLSAVGLAPIRRRSLSEEAYLQLAVV